MQFELEGHEYIELNRLLKLLNMTESGGQANMFIAEGEVIVNKVVETRKRKKLRKGDIVDFGGEIVEIIE